MAIIPAGSILKYVITFVSQGQNISQLVGYLRLLGGADSDSDTYLDDLEIQVGNFLTEWIDIANSQCVCSSVKGYLVTPLGELNLGERSIGVPGNATGDHLAHGVAGVVRGTVESSKGQMRKYIPGLDESVTIQGNWTAFAIGKLIAIGQILFRYWDFANNPLLTEAYQPGTYDKTRAPDFKPSAQDVLLSVICGYQRRRKPGVGI